MQAKATSFLQWAKCVREAALKNGKIPLFVNMDETSVSYNYGKGKGLVISKDALPPGKSHRKEPVSSSDAKSHVSFLAFITHDSSVQPKLPQIFIGNHHRFTHKLLKSVFPHTPDGYYLWREVSSWNNHELMCRALKLLAKHLKDYLVSHQLVLVLDVAKCHLHSSIYSLAHRLGVILLYVPAKLTWLLQPADTHVFFRLKLRLRQLWLDMRVKSISGEVSHADWVTAVLGLTRKLLCGFQWRNAFGSDGLLDECKIGSRVLAELGWSSPQPVSADILTKQQLQCVMPKRMKDAHAAIFSWALPKAEAKAKAQAKPATFALAAGPISSGTRSKKKAIAID
jgi:hypothetical protein